jgi:hypothetical protein
MKTFQSVLMTLLLYKVWLSINDNAVNSTEMAFHTNQHPLLTNRKKRRIRHFKRRSRVINNSHTVVNLSSHQLTENETILLSKGLNFCPVPGPINETKLSEELDNFARGLRIKEHFGSKEVEGGDEVSSDSDSEDACDNRFVKKTFIDNVKSDILRTVKVNTDTFDNLTPGERIVLQNLRSNEDIIIKPAEKAVLLLWTNLPTFENPTKQFSDEITNELNNMYDNGDIDEKTLEYDTTDYL